MSTANWARGVSGSFNNPADWSESPPPSNIVPDGTYDAELSATGTYTVTSSESNTVYGLGLSAHATLAITEGTFIDVNGTDAADDAGTIAIDNNTVFLVGLDDTNLGSIPLDVSGAITLNSTGSPTTLVLDGAGSGTNTIDLYGGGKLTLSSNAGNLITINTPGTILETSDTIGGSGTISGVILQNSGLINANGLKALIIRAGLDDTNTGTIEATSTGGLILQASTFDNLSGTIAAAAAGAVVTLETVIITDGIVSTVAGSSIINASGSGDEINVGSVNNAGTININPNSFLLLGAAIEVDNSGTIELNANGAQQAQLQLAGVVLFEGKGRVTLSDNPGNLIESNGAAATLNNQNNTISGAGTIGDGFTTFANSGLIDGTGKNPLIIAATAADVENFGTMESSNTGGLEFLNVTVNDESAGMVATTTSGSHIDLSNSTIEFGSMKIVAGSTLDSVAGTTDEVSPSSALDNAGTLAVNNGSTLVLGNTVNNTGIIVLDGNSLVTTLKIDGDIYLEDAGKVELPSSNDKIVSNGTTALLTNVANTISGEGSIGDSFLNFTNDALGVVDATGGFGAPLYILTNSTLNDGTMEDTGAGGLGIASPLVNDGTVESAGAGGVTINNTIDNNGKLIADNGILSIIDAPSGTGSLAIGDTGEISFGSPATDITENVTFSSGATGTLAFAAAATTTPTAIYDGTISGFGTSDAIDLVGLSYVPGSTSVVSTVFSAGDTTVTVTNGTDTVALTFAGNLTSHTFLVGDDATFSGGTLLTDPVSKAATTRSIPVNVPLLGSYMASLFATAEAQVVATTTAAEATQSQAVLAHPHTG